MLSGSAAITYYQAMWTEDCKVMLDKLVDVNMKVHVGGSVA